MEEVYFDAELADLNGTVPFGKSLFARDSDGCFYETGVPKSKSNVVGAIKVEGRKTTETPQKPFSFPPQEMPCIFKRYGLEEYWNRLNPVLQQRINSELSKYNLIKQIMFRTNVLECIKNGMEERFIGMFEANSKDIVLLFKMNDFFRKSPKKTELDEKRLFEEREANLRRKMREMRKNPTCTIPLEKLVQEGKIQLQPRKREFFKGTCLKKTSLKR
jgi:hypothetical protein